MDNIKRSVGNAGQNDVEDVALVELALFTAKRANGQAYYPYGQFTGDGRRRESLEALMAFQVDQRLEPNGSLRPGDATFAALRRKVPDKVRRSAPIRGSSLIPSLSDGVKRAAREVIFDISRKAPLPPLNNRPDIAMELQSILIGTGGRALTPISAIDIEVTTGGFFTAKLSFRKLTSWDNRPHSVLEKAYLIAVNQGLARAQHWTGLSGNRTSTRRAFDALKGIGPADHFRIAPYLQERGISARPTHMVSKACVAALAYHEGRKRSNSDRPSLNKRERGRLIDVIRRVEPTLAQALTQKKSPSLACYSSGPVGPSHGSVEALFDSDMRNLKIEVSQFKYLGSGFEDDDMSFKINARIFTATLIKEDYGNWTLGDIELNTPVAKGRLDFYHGEVEFKLGLFLEFSPKEAKTFAVRAEHAFLTFRILERGMQECQ